ncbi:STAS-like domain-containing protein [Comamonas serinivorans]|nr:STAS-like domain-containing protein [Comamonas serinivorans]
MKTCNISIARDFSTVPAGRYATDGDVSGEVFRECLLRPVLLKGLQVTIDLDDTEGYGSSFLEEAFGGLVREGFTANQLKTMITFISHEDPSLIEEILTYIDDAQRNQH